jgi:hypothetical protein
MPRCLRRPARKQGKPATSSTAIFQAAHLTDVEFESGAAQVLAVSGASNPVAGAAEHDAVRHACAGDGGDAAHGAGQPPVVELQGPGQVGACAAVGAVPLGGQGGQFPDGVDVAGPAVPQLIAAVVLAEDGVGPPPQVGQPRVVGVAVQANPVRSTWPVRGRGVERLGDRLRQVLEPGGQVQIATEPGLVEPGTEQAARAPPRKSPRRRSACRTCR